MQQQLKPVAAAALIDQLSAAWNAAAAEVASYQPLSALYRQLVAQSRSASVLGDQNSRALLKVQTSTGHHDSSMLSPSMQQQWSTRVLPNLSQPEQLPNNARKYHSTLGDGWRTALIPASSSTATSNRHQSFGAERQYSSSMAAKVHYQLDEVHTVNTTAVWRSSGSSNSNQHQISPRQRPKVVAVALSGGVDSAVAALLLKQQGYEVFGVFMHNWDPSDEAGSEAPACTAAADLEDAKAVAASLKIPLYEADFVSKYWNNVFEQFLEGLEQGLTPNPDLACNSHIKFGALLEFAKGKGADVMATGHYARLGWVPGQAAAEAGATAVERETPATAASPTKAATAAIAATAAAGIDSVTGTASYSDMSPVLLTGSDSQKDQTYFLAGLHHQQLAQSVFPVGERMAAPPLYHCYCQHGQRSRWSSCNMLASLMSICKAGRHTWDCCSFAKQ
jgi:rhodanese-related sulfurtransferase